MVTKASTVGPGSRRAVTGGLLPMSKPPPHLPTQNSTADPAADAARPRHWDASIARDPPTIDYASVMESEDAVARWTSLIVSPLDPSRLITSNPA